jgi:hypothetical protein
VDGQDVYLLYGLNVGTPPVILLVCRWFHVNDDDYRKISSLRLAFDPRPFLQRHPLAHPMIMHPNDNNQGSNDDGQVIVIITRKAKKGKKWEL